MKKMMIHLIAKPYIILLLLLTLTYHVSAQGISDLGTVWSKQYGSGSIVNIKHNKGSNTYTAGGAAWTTLAPTPTPAGLQRLDGLIMEFSESGEVIKRAVVRIPQSYTNTHTYTRASANFRVVFKTDDGGFLAFGWLYNPDAPLSEKQPAWAGGAIADAGYLTVGFWVVKLDKDLNVIVNRLEQGMSSSNGWQTADGNFVIGGFDANKEMSYTGTSTNITLLRKYDQAGVLIKDARANHREINNIYKFPADDSFIAITPDKVLRIDANLTITAANLTTILTGYASGPHGNSISPAAAGGVFIRSPLISVNDPATQYNNGYGFFKLSSTNTVTYAKIDKPAAWTYSAPLLLPGTNNPLKYIGVASNCGTDLTGCTNYIYELTDDGTFNYRVGTAYPDNTVLNTISKTDGFFSCGTTTTGLAAIAKLSTCANFKASPVTDIYVPYANSVTIAQAINYVGAKAATINDVKYTLETKVLKGKVNNVAVGGILETVSSTQVTGFAIAAGSASGKVLDLNRTYTLDPSLSHAEIEVTLTIQDNFLNGGQPQSCSQTYVFKIIISKASSNLFSDDVWFFGQNASGAKTSKGIIFKNGVATNASNISMVNSRENSLSVSTPACNGSFVFYASHDHVFNSLHQAMKGGIATNPLTDPGKFDGHTSNSDGLGAVYIGNNKYVLLSVTTEGDVGDLIYYIVDMTKENGLGELSLRGTIDASKKVGETIELIPKVGTYDEYWLIYYRSDVNKFFVYLLKGNNGNPTMTKMDEYASNLPQTTAHVYDLQANATFTSIVALHSNHFALFSFDPMTGKLVYRKTVDNGSRSGGLYSAEFSPNNKYLYLTDIWVPSASPRLFQYDVTDLSNPTYVTSVAYSHANTSSEFQGGSTKIGPDGKMYIVRSHTNQMAVIANPNAQLTTAGINLNGFQLSSSGGEDLHISTGLTPPWVNPPTSNTAPNAVKDLVTTETRYGTLVVKPLINDTDDGDPAALNLNGVSFVTATDASKGTLSWSPTNKDVTFVPNPLYNFVNGEKIHLNYIVKDVGIPVALCAEGEIEITWRFVIANNDIATALQKTPNNPIKVTLNDSIPVGCTPNVSIVTGPTHGTASVSGLNVLYTPTGDYTGPDALTYKITCGTQTSTATVAINVIKLPDNISDAECFLKDPPASAWGIKEVPFYTEIMHTLVSPIVGDINGDGKSEIVALSKADQRTLRVISDKGILLKSFTMPATMDYESLAMARIKTASGIKGFIYAVVGTNIYGYNYETGSVWQVPYTQKISSQKSLNIADFNNDGFAEISCGGSIYDAETGYLLCSTSGNYGYTTGWVGASKTQSFPANVIGDEKLELVAGNKIFNVNITSRTNSALNSITLAKTLTTPITTACGTYTPADGTTQIVDINNDGRLDVVVQDLIQTTKTAWLYAWDAETEKLIAATCVPNVLSINIPLIGDVDGDQKPEMILMGSEIGYNTNGKDSLYAFVYDGTLLFKKKWTFKHADPSGATGLTLFDFNQDKTYELVYRDEKNLRILSVVGTTLIDRVSIPCLSYTGYEHPIVVDLDGDGSAEIITIGQSSGNYQDNKGPIRVFKSLNQPWAPARPVWNQYAYNAVNVNDDLTIPRYQLSPATVFPGVDGVFGTPDDVRPYNAFLQQQTTLNKNGTPLWLTPNAEIGLPAPIFNYSAVGDSMQIKLVINNVGDAALQDPVNITVYKDVVGSATKYTYAYPKAILAGASATISFAIPNFRTWLGVTNSTTQLIVKINDKGDGANDQAVCADTKVKYTKPYGNLLMANTDHASGFTNSTITEKVLNNDSTATCTRGTLTKFDTIPASGLKNGSLVINTDSTFTYTPKLNFVGMDSVTYYIKCGADSSAAKVYFLIVKPNSQAYTACPNAVVTVGVKAIAGVTFRWYTTATGGTVPAHSLTAIVTKDASASQSVWVEAEYKGVKYPRIEVKIGLGNCGVTVPTDCAKDGTVIFKEDFGGNAVSDPDVKATGIPQVIGYTYNGTGVGANNYGIRKKGSSNQGWWYEVDDHTFPSDYSRGYLLQVDGTVTKGQLYLQELTNLCTGTNLLFSIWMTSVVNTAMAVDKANLIFHIIDRHGNIILEYSTGNIPDQDPTWKQYGFQIKVPTGESSLTLKIFNNGTGSSGNDFVLDDIEVRFCAPPVVTLPAKDTVICLESDLDIQLGTEFIDDGTFGANLDYRWEFRAQESAIWNIISGTGGSTTNGKVAITESKHLIASATAAHTGDYRFMVAAAGNINSINCRAVSESFHVLVAPPVRTADIRVQVCPDASPGASLNLSSYLHVIHPQLDWGVTWGNVSAIPYSPAVNSTDPKGAVSLAFATGTHTYKYKMENKCGMDSARFYITSLNTTTIQMPPQRVVICRDMAENIHINQILGVEARGVITSNLAPAIATDHILNVASPSPFAGAVVFNGKTAYDDTRITPDPYKGDVKATRVMFTYTADNASCLTQKTYAVELIITTNILN